jgi:hypothetical protein
MQGHLLLWRSALADRKRRDTHLAVLRSAATKLRYEDTAFGANPNFAGLPVLH